VADGLPGPELHNSRCSARSQAVERISSRRVLKPDIAKSSRLTTRAGRVDPECTGRHSPVTVARCAPTA